MSFKSTVYVQSAMGELKYNSGRSKTNPVLSMPYALRSQVYQKVSKNKLKSLRKRLGRLDTKERTFSINTDISNSLQ